MSDELDAKVLDLMSDMIDRGFSRDEVQLVQTLWRGWVEGERFVNSVADLVVDHEGPAGDALDEIYEVTTGMIYRMNKLVAEGK